MFYSFAQLLELKTLPPIGKKAASLLMMLQQGAPVPPGACLTTEALESFLEPLADQRTAFFGGQLTEQDWEAAVRDQALPAALQQALKDWLTDHPDSRWAVRSSGVQEDLAEASFAGLYTTELNVTGYEALESAIKTCWLSMYDQRVLTYAKKHGIQSQELQLGVILQAMIPAEKSGVLFSVHPLKGRDTQMLVEAAPGLGEALVSGALTPDQYVYDWKQQRLISSEIHPQVRCLVTCDQAPFTRWQTRNQTEAMEPVLNESQVTELAALALQIQIQSGFPVDIEWCYWQERFYLLQARPITRLHYQAIEGEWTTADFKDGGVASDVCTPLMWSLYDYIWEQTMPSYLRKTHLLSPESEHVLWGQMFFARPYWNVGAVKAGLYALPGFVEREFDEDLGIEVSYEGKGHVTPNNLKTLGHGLRVLGALKRSFEQRLAYNHVFSSRQQRRLQELEALQPNSWSDQELFQHYSHLLLEDYFTCESSYFYHIFDNSNVTTLFKDRFKPFKGKVNYLALLSGLTDLSHLRQNFELWALSRTIREAPEALAYWQSPIDTLLADWQAQTDRPMLPELSAYLQKFYYHSTRELDITVARYGEDPRFVFESLQTLLKLEDNLDPLLLNQRQHAEYLQARKQLLAAAPFYQRRNLALALEQLRLFLWWREELRDLSTRMYAQIRRFTLLVAQRLVQQQQLSSPDEIFFLTMTQVLNLLRGELSSQAAAEVVAREQAYYASFKHFRNPNEIGSRYKGQSSKVTGNVLKGVAGSPGQVTGVARVIADIEDADRLQPGDILITRFTDPGWTPKFGLLAAVATETGGQLSHAAVISREYGIPAVLAVNGLTERIKDGQQILINGDEGCVVLDPQPQPEKPNRQQTAAKSESA